MLSSKTCSANTDSRHSCPHGGVFHSFVAFYCLAFPSTVLVGIGLLVVPTFHSINSIVPQRGRYNCLSLLLLCSASTAHRSPLASLYHIKLITTRLYNIVSIVLARQSTGINHSIAGVDLWMGFNMLCFVSRISIYNLRFRFRFRSHRLKIYTGCLKNKTLVRMQHPVFLLQSLAFFSCNKCSSLKNTGISYFTFDC